MPDLPKTPFDDLDPAAVLRPQDIADRLRVDVRSVRRAIGRGELVASRTCGLRVLACDAAAWWRARIVRVGPAIAPAVEPRADVVVLDGAPARRRRQRVDARLPLPPRTGRAS